MIEITSSKELRKWLKGRDKQTCVAIAARIALRVVPFLEKVAYKHGDALVLPSFYAISTSWLASTRPSQDVVSAATAAAAAATAAAAAATAAATTAAAAAAYAAYAYANAAATTAAATDATAATTTAAAAAYATAAAAAAAISNVWQEISYDVTFLEVGNTVGALMERPLFLGGMGPELKKRWQLMKETLLSLNENWQVWTNWYEDRLVGGPRPNGRLVIEALERERVLIPGEDWEKGPAHVNALIAEMEKRYRLQDDNDHSEGLGTRGNDPIVFNTSNIITKRPALSLSGKHQRIITSETYIEDCDVTVSSTFFKKEANLAAFFDQDAFIKDIGLNDIVRCAEFTNEEKEAAIGSAIEKVFISNLDGIAEDEVGRFLNTLWEDKFIIYERSPPDHNSLAELAKLLPEIVGVLGGSPKKALKAIVIFSFGVIVIHASLGIGEALEQVLKERIIHSLKSSQGEPDQAIEQEDNIRLDDGPLDV